MNFLKFVQQSPTFQRQTKPQVISDEIFKRYLTTKYMVQAVFVGLVVNCLKTMTQNLTRRKYRRLSPWIELAVASVYFTEQPLPHRFDLARYYDDQDMEKQWHLTRYRMKFYTNSQYWH